MTNETTPSSRTLSGIKALPLGARIRWARKTARLSHDGLVSTIGRSNRGHLIKVEKGVHAPGRDLRDAIADACGVPRDLFDTDDDDEPSMEDALLQSIIDARVRAALRKLVAA